MGGDLTQKNLVGREHETKPIDEIIQIMKSVFNNKPLRGLKYGVEAAVMNFMKLMNFQENFLHPQPYQNQTITKVSQEKEILNE